MKKEDIFEKMDKSRLYPKKGETAELKLPADVFFPDWDPGILTC